MGVSKHRKGHKEKLASYKASKKKEQESFKKKMIDNYIKMQQENLANKEEHTSTQETVGPEIDINELNEVVDLQSNVEFIDAIDVDVDIDNSINIIENDNNNQ